MRNRNTDLIQTVHGVTFPFVGVSQVPSVQLQAELRTRDAEGKPSFDAKHTGQDDPSSILTKASGKIL